LICGSRKKQDAVAIKVIVELAAKPGKRGELQKLGIHVAKRTIQKYMRQARGPRPWRQSWLTFVENHLLPITARSILDGLHHDDWRAA